MRQKTAITFFSALFFIVFEGQSQQIPYFENITEKEGLSDNHITCFLKDRAGYLWIGTENGLNRYDGNTFKVYTPSLAKKNYLSNAFITSVKQDLAGDIWVSTRKGINRIDAQTDTTEVFFAYSIKDHIDFSESVFWDVFPDNDTTVWLAIDSKSFVRFNPKTNHATYFDFRSFLSEKNIEYTSFYHSVFKILEKSKEELWLATTEGIFSFNKVLGSFALEAGVAIDGITFFYYDTISKYLYCADERRVLFIYESGKKQLARVNIDARAYKDKSLTLSSLSNNELFIPSPEGVALVNQKREVVAFLQGNTTMEQMLLPGKVTTAYKDRDKIVWLGTTKGVSKFVPRLNANLHVAFPENLEFDPIFALKNFIYRPEKGEWWVASFNDNKIWAVNNKTGKISAFNKPPIYAGDTCYAFYSRHPDTLFFLCEESLLTFFPKKNKWNKLTIPAPWKTGSLTCMAIDLEGNYWLGTRRKGLFIYSPNSKTIWAPSEKEFKTRIIHSLEFDSLSGCVWIATAGKGLVKYTLREKKFEVIQRDDKNPMALHSSLINDISIDLKGNVWVATKEGGLARLSPNADPQKEVNNYDMKSGMPDDNVCSVQTDGKGNTWFTTIKGIGMVDSAGNIKALYNNVNGLPYSKFRQSIVALPGGEIATTINNKLICFTPNSLLQVGNAPVLINEVYINDSILVSGPRPIITYQHNSIQFNFSALDFVSPGAIEYFFKLDGFEPAWISNGKSHTIRYSALPPGNYVFNVKARKINGEFYDKIARFSFRIQPAFWQTFWFRLVILAFIAWFVYLLFKRRVGAIRAKATIAQQMIELEVKALRAQMNPHFIFNAMNSIQQFTLKNDTDNANVYISKFATLLRKVLHSSQQLTINLAEEIEQISLYLDIEKLRMGPEFSYTLVVDEEIETDALRLPGMLIQPFVENSLKHGLPLKEGEKNIIIEFLLPEEYCLRITITDNGIGRKKAATIKEQQQKMLPYEPKGILMVEERIRFLPKSPTIRNFVSIEDLFSKEGLSSGTKVIINIPLNGL